MVKIENQLKEFARSSLGLFGQRQATFVGATLLAAYYVNIEMAIISYALCQISEFFDYVTSKRVLKWDGKGAKAAAKHLSLLTLSSIISSVAVVQYIILVALAEGPSIHIGPLFFLFCAAIFAAMNNCQVPRILGTRMAIYTAVFIFIPAYDLWIVRPPMDSELWKQMGVVLFVLYFVIECSRKFLQSYQTGRLQLEELGIERDRVAKAYEMQSHFVSTVSHELRTPLTSIKGSIDLINSGKMGPLPDKLGGVIEIARKNSDRLAFLIDDILDFQKIKSGEMTYRFSKIDLVQLMQEAVDVNKSCGTLRDVSVSFKSCEVPVHVKGDPDRLMQVMANVLSNAIKFSHAGGVVEVVVDARDGKGLVTVQDCGIGIPEGSENLVFSPFMQVDASDRRDHGGTGLGMAITRQILSGHGGSIDYTSEVGAGTTFTIQLVALHVDPEVAKTGAPKKRKSTNLTTQTITP